MSANSLEFESPGSDEVKKIKIQAKRSLKNWSILIPDYY